MIMYRFMMKKIVRKSKENNMFQLSFPYRDRYGTIDFVFQLLLRGRYVNYVHWYHYTMTVVNSTIFFFSIAKISEKNQNTVPYRTGTVLYSRRYFLFP